MDRLQFKTKPYHLVTDPKTGEIKRVVFSADAQVGTAQIGANLNVFGKITGSFSGSSVNVWNDGKELTGGPFTTLNFVGATLQASSSLGVVTVTGFGGGSSGVTLQASGSTVTGSPFATLNVVAQGPLSASIVNAGGGTATLTISGSLSGSGVTVRSSGVDSSTSQMSTLDFINGTVTVVGSVAKVSLPTSQILPTAPGLRLTLSSSVPVVTTDAPSGSILYYTPYTSGLIWTYDSSVWAPHLTNEISLTLSTLLSGDNYDVFAYWTGSAVALELSNAWASTTTRSDALARQDGVQVKSSDHSRRYIGTIRTTGGTTTEDSKTNRYLYNEYNRVTRFLLATEFSNTANWQYGSTVIRPANNDSRNSFNYVTGDAATILRARVDTSAGGVVSGSGRVGIGIDSTTVNSSTLNTIHDTLTGNALSGPFAVYRGYPGLGKHSATWLEWSQSNSNVRFFGTQSGDSVHGLVGEIEI